MFLRDARQRPLYDAHVPLIINNDFSTVYFLSEPVYSTADRVCKVHSADGTEHSVDFDTCFFGVVEYRPCQATILRIDSVRGVVIVRISGKSRADGPEILNVEDILAVCDLDRRDYVPLTVPILVFNKSQLAKDLMEELGHASRQSMMLTVKTPMITRGLLKKLLCSRTAPDKPGR